MSNVALLPALLIVGPILFATVPIALGLRYDRTGWSVALATCSGLFAASAYLASVVYTSGPVVHNLGGYPADYGIELVVDEFSMLLILLVTAIASSTLAFTRRGGPRGNPFYSAWLLLTGGLLGISMTGDIFNMFVFLEIVGLATYALISTGDGPESAVAALKYLILGTVGASLYLLGVGFLFMATGTLNMGVLAGEIPALDGQNLTLAHAAFGFMLVGFTLKVAQWPLHTWQPDAYQHAPDGVTALIAALVSTVYAYAMGRLFYTVFGPEFLTSTPYATEIIVTIGCVSVLAGSTLAVVQQDVKRMFAYSSVAQFGLIVAAYGLATETAFVGAAVHLISHGLIKAGLFVAAAIVAIGYGARTVDEYAGLGTRRPFVAGAIAILLIALIGIPPSAGFVGKWYIAVGAVEAEMWPVAAVVFFSTMLTLAYSARLLETMYFTPAPRVPSPDPSGPIATDGGDADDPDGPVDTAPEAIDRGTPDAVSIGMLGLVVVVAIVAVAVGFAGGVVFELLDPFLTEVFVE